MDVFYPKGLGVVFCAPVPVHGTTKTRWDLKQYVSQSELRIWILRLASCEVYDCFPRAFSPSLLCWFHLGSHILFFRFLGFWDLFVIRFSIFRVFVVRVLVGVWACEQEWKLQLLFDVLHWPSLGLPICFRDLELRLQAVLPSLFDWVMIIVVLR